MKCPECGSHTWLAKKCIQCGYEFKPTTSKTQRKIQKKMQDLKSDCIPLYLRIELYLAVVIIFSFFALFWIDGGPLLQIKAYKLGSTLNFIGQLEYGEDALDFTYMNFLWIAPVASFIAFALSYNGYRKIAYFLLNLSATTIIAIMGYYLFSTNGQSLQVFGIGAWLAIIASLVAWVANGKYNREKAQNKTSVDKLGDEQSIPKSSGNHELHEDTENTSDHE